MVRSQRRPLRINALLKSIYTDLRHPASFSSPYTLFRAAEQKNRNIHYKDVESWLETQPVYTKYRRIKVKYPHHKVLSRGLRYQYQADLVDYSALKRDNRSFTFLLTIIDIFSRFALAIPIKSKKGLHVAAALEKCYIVELGPNCKFIDLLFKRSVLIFIKISSFIVSLFQKLFTVRQTHSQKN